MKKIFNYVLLMTIICALSSHTANADHKIDVTASVIFGTASIEPIVKEISASGYSDDITVTFKVEDNNLYEVSLQYKVSTATTWSNATISGTTTGLVPFNPHTITWHSFQDVPGADAEQYQVRISATDTDTNTGPQLQSASFTLINTYRTLTLKNSGNIVTLNDGGVVTYAQQETTTAHANKINVYNYPDTLQLNNGTWESYPQINSSGHILWESKNTGSTDSQIFFYNGFSGMTSQLSSVFGINSKQQINDNDCVVWILAGTTLYYHDGVSVVIIPCPTINISSPKMNNNNKVVWSGISGSLEDIYVYDAGTHTTNMLTTPLTVNTNPCINDNNFIAWQASGDIFVYNNVTITNITSSVALDNIGNINNVNQIVWSGHDGSDYEIFVYDCNGGTTTQITSNSQDDIDPRINDSGVVVWSGSDGTDYEIFLYDGTTKQITFDEKTDSEPEINERNYLAWKTWDTPTRTIAKLSVPTTTPELDFLNVNQTTASINLVWFAGVGLEHNLSWTNGLEGTPDWAQVNDDIESHTDGTKTWSDKTYNTTNKRFYKLTTE